MKPRALIWILALIVSGAFCIYLAGNDLVPLFDRDEPRYAQTSRQMLQSGDWVTPHFLDKVRTAKPIFIYWCQAFVMAGLGDNEYAARFPSAVAMAAVVALLAITVWRSAGPQRGLWAAFILSSSGLAIASAKMCLTDAVLLLWVTIGQLCLYRLWNRGFSIYAVVLFGIATGLAGLTKGPVAIAISLTTLLALWLIGKTTDRHRGVPAWSRRELVVAILIFIAAVSVVAAPWLIAIHVRSPGFLATAWGHDVVDRVQRGQEGHAQPPGFYALVIWGTYFPWSILLPGALWCAWRFRYLPQIRFALAATVGPWLMFELITTKLPHYVLPTFPALAFMTSDFLIRAQRGQILGLRTFGFRIAIWIWAALLAAVGLAIPAMLFTIKIVDRPVALGAICIAIIAVTMAVGAAYRFCKGRVFAAGRAMGVGMFAIVLMAWLFFLPGFKPLNLSNDIAQMIQRNGGYAASGFMIDYKEPSLAFAQGGGLREQPDDDYLIRTNSEQWPTWIILTQRIWIKTPAEIKDKWEEVGIVGGIAYAGGPEKKEVLVLRKKTEDSR